MAGARLLVGGAGGGPLHFLQASQLLEEAPAAAEEYRSCGTFEQAPRFNRDQVRSQNEQGSARFRPSRRPSRLGGSHLRLQGRLQILSVRRGVFVQNHEIHRQLLHPPILMRAEEVADDLQIPDVVDPAHHDWHVAGNAVRPQRGRLALAA